jgi:hypothetical protein
MGMPYTIWKMINAGGGSPGKSAYECYVEITNAAHETVLSESAWLSSLQGPPGDTVDISNKVDKITNYSLVANTEITKIHSLGSDNQDLSGLQPKESGKGLSANDYSTAEKTKLTGIETGANNYTHPANHSPSIITQDVSNRFATDTEKTTWNGKASQRLFANLSAPVASSGTTEKVLLQLMIPAARAVVGSTFRAWIIGNSSTTGTLIFRVKCGANGTISDTEDWKSVTSAGQVANQRAGFDALITIRSATTIAVDGIGYAGTVQLPTTIAAPATPAIVISGNWYINLTVVCSSGVFTGQVGSIEEIK